MFTVNLVSVLNALYLIPMGLLCVVGTAAMLKFMYIILRREPRHTQTSWNISVEDA